jgi:peptidyl-prolyl cis-trans isomerase A (cyclophilin A)
MNMYYKIISLLVILQIFGSWSIGTAQIPVIIETEFGNIEIELYDDKAPVTVKNFLVYVDSGLFRDASFYRVVSIKNQPVDSVKIEVIQGGRRDQPGNRFPPIRHETTKETGIVHTSGVISMARSRPGTASSEFFICIGDQPELDFGGRRNSDGQGFAAFGRVTAGMEIVMRIHREAPAGQYLSSGIVIRNIFRKL